MFQKVGLLKPYETTNSAQGRLAVTGQESDRMVFKVPTLRNVELTYPYFHDGSVQTLEEAVDLMAKMYTPVETSSPDRPTAEEQKGRSHARGPSCVVN